MDLNPPLGLAKVVAALTEAEWQDIIHLRVINMGNLDRDVIEFVLTKYRSWAIVGASNNPSRPSNDVMSFMDDLGYRVIPINPNEETVLGKKCYKDLAAASLDHEIEVVDVFRKPSEALNVARQALAINARAIWFQLGVVSFEAASLGEEAGLLVVMDACPKIEIPKLGIS